FTDLDGNGTWSAAEPFNDVNSNGTYDPPIAQTDLDTALSGTAGIFNHYVGIPGTLSSVIPSPPIINGNQDLEAALRVKNGMVGLSGNASVGNSGAVSGGKSTIAGSYVSAGYGGNQGVNSVFSDNGATRGYDLGALGITFPLITGLGADKYV